MPRQRRTGTVSQDKGNEAQSTEQESNNMSDLVFEPMTAEDWTESGAGAQARKGEYGQILVSFADSGQRYARINTAKDSGGRFAGKKASSVSTALKSARDSKNAPEAIAQIEISGRGDTVYLENKAVEA